MTGLTLEELASELKRLRDWISSPLLCRKDLMRRYGISESTLHRWIRQKGLLPDPVRMAGPRWRLADLEAAEASGQIRRPDTSGQTVRRPG